MASPKKPETIEEYITAAAPVAQPHLHAIYRLLKEAAPEAAGAIKWSRPALSLDRILFVFAAHKHHLGFYPTPAAVTAFEEELSGFGTGSSSIKFPYDEPLPDALIRKIADWRVREVIENDASWM